MIQNALTIGARTVGQAMTPLEHMKTIASDTRLDAPSIASIVKLAHSRIPVYEGAPHNVRSVLMMRKLILTDTAVAPMVALLPQRQPLVVAPSTNLIDMLNEFQLGRSHFALVVVDPEKVKRLWARGTPLDEGDVVGLITCDDVMEELIGASRQPASRTGLPCKGGMGGSIEAAKKGSCRTPPRARSIHMCWAVFVLPLCCCMPLPELSPRRR
jgi:metal transporter CNNM